MIPFSLYNTQFILFILYVFFVYMKINIFLFLFLFLSISMKYIFKIFWKIFIFVTFIRWLVMNILLHGHYHINYLSTKGLVLSFEIHQYIEDMFLRYYIIIIIISIYIALYHALLKACEPT